MSVPPMPSQADVAIIGGGPAGVSTALALLKYSDLSVAVIEKSDLGGVRVGEHVSPTVFDLLGYLAIKRGDFSPECFSPSYGSTSYWGSPLPLERDSIFTTDESTYQIDREDFDLTLIEIMAERGGRFLPRTHCQGITPSASGGWDLLLAHPEEGGRKLAAGFIIDASGRGCSTHRQLGFGLEKMDRLTGVGCVFQPPPDRVMENRLVVETVEIGWWYVAKLRSDRIAAILFTDADLVSQMKLQRPARWAGALSRTTQVKELLSGCLTDRSSPWVRSAASQFSEFSGMGNFLAVGEAACAFDPISSMGIGFAIRSGCQAALVARSVLETGSPDAIHIYQNDLRSNFESYLQHQRAIYQQERRWADSTFWKRRAGGG